MSASDLKERHDALLAAMPEGAQHDSANCPQCASDINDTDNRRGEPVKTYTEEELAAEIARAIAEAKAPLEARVAELTAADAEEELTAKINAAVAPLQAEVAELKTKLEDADLAAETAKKAHDDLVAWLDGEAAAQTAAAEAAARKDERIAKAKEVAPAMSEDHINKYADNWAEMSDEAFDERLAEWASLNPVKPTSLPSTTSLQTSRDAGERAESAAKAAISLRLEGVDVRSIPDTRGI